MSIYTRTELLERIDAWKAAELAAAAGKSYTIGSRTLTRYDLAEIRAQLQHYENELASLGQPRGMKRVSMRMVR